MKKVKKYIKEKWQKLQKIRSKHFHPHKSFKRSYREDYVRDTNIPGYFEHAIESFKIIFKNLKVFAPFIILMVVAYIFLVGLMNEEFYQSFQESIDASSEEEGATKITAVAKAGLVLLSTVTSGGLDTGMTEVGSVFMIILFLIMWLVTVYLVRHFLKGSKPKLRDALYNALTPLISTLAVFIVICVQFIPVFLVGITYSAAVNTGFLDTPFYALIYFIFCATMILLTTYCLSSSLIGLAAVTAPGVYPMTALFSASDLMMGRRTNLIGRLVLLILIIAIIYGVIMVPVILIDMWLKSSFNFLSDWPIVPFFLLVVTCFIFIYLAVFVYRYYRYLLDYKEK